MAGEKFLDVDTSEISRNLEKMAARFPEVVDELVRDVAIAVEKEARDRTPVDTGALKASGQAVYRGGRHGGEEGPAFAEQPGPGEAFVAFTQDYAAAVHEDLDAQHPGGGEAKFLERAMEAVGPEMMERIGRDLMRKVAP